MKIEVRVMVAGYVEQGLVQYRNDVLQIGVGQIAAAKNQVNILKMAIGGQQVEAFHNVIADG